MKLISVKRKSGNQFLRSAVVPLSVEKVIPRLRSIFANSRTLKIVSGVLMIFILAVIASKLDLEKFGNSFSSIPLGFLAAAGAVLSANVFVSCLRLRSVLSDFGFEHSWQVAFKANIFGHLAGMVFFQFFGQTLGRKSILKRSGIPMSAVVVVTAYERLVALSILSIVCAVGVYHVFGTFVLDTENGGMTFIRLSITFSAVVVFSILFGFGSLANLVLRNLATTHAALKLLKTVCMTFVAQMLMMSGYGLIGFALVPDLVNSDFFAATAIVMFAASLPISFSGWGIREISAVYAMGAVGVNMEVALTISITVGLVSTAILFLYAGIFSIYGQFKKKAPLVDEVDPKRTNPALDYNRLLCWIVPLAAVIFVFFQIHVPTRGMPVNVNLADPLVLIGGPLFLIIWFLERQPPAWRVEGVTAFVFTATAVICVALLIGFSEIGVTTWAVTNRFTGWFVLMAYGATGAAIMLADKVNARPILYRTFIAAACAMVTLEYLPILGYAIGLPVPEEFLSYYFQGFSQNRNAFGFQLILAFGVLIAFGKTPLWPRSWLIWPIFAAILSVGIWNTQSRAAFIAYVILLLVAIIYRAVPRKLVTPAIILTGFLGILPSGFIILRGLLFQNGIKLSIMSTLKGAESSDNERLISIYGGLDLWAQNPIFGAGIGTYVENFTREFSHPLIIHNTAVWLLAETGLVGFAVFAGAFLWVLWHVRPRSIGKVDDPVNLVIFLSLIAFAVETIAHDLLYQRTFWLLLGASLALPVIKRRKVS